jgi:RNA-directed DNA polymerase
VVTASSVRRRSAAWTVISQNPDARVRPASCARATENISGDHDLAKVDMVDRLNRQLRGWAAFYNKYTDFTATTFRHVDHIVFWKMAHWLARKYRSRIKPLMRSWYRASVAGQAKTWFVHGVSERGHRVGKALHRLVSSPKGQFRWRNPEANPYIFREEPRNTITSRYRDVAMAMGQT